MAQQLPTSESLGHALAVDLDLLTEDKSMIHGAYQGGGDEHLPANGEALDTRREVDWLTYDPILRAFRRANIAYHRFSGMESNTHLDFWPTIFEIIFIHLL